MCFEKIEYDHRITYSSQSKRFCEQRKTALQLLFVTLHSALVEYSIPYCQAAAVGVLSKIRHPLMTNKILRNLLPTKVYVLYEDEDTVPNSCFSGFGRVACFLFAFAGAMASCAQRTSNALDKTGVAAKRFARLSAPADDALALAKPQRIVVLWIDRRGFDNGARCDERADSGALSV